MPPLWSSVDPVMSGVQEEQHSTDTVISGVQTLVLMGVRHDGPPGLMQRNALRTKLADCLNARKGSEACQRAIVLHGEHGLAADIAGDHTRMVLEKALVAAGPSVARDVSSRETHAAAGDVIDLIEDDGLGEEDLEEFDNFTIIVENIICGAG